MKYVMNDSCNMTSLCGALFFTFFSLYRFNDYWVNYDKSDNCRDKYIMDYIKKIEPLRCAHIRRGTQDEQFQECKAELKRQLVATCPYTDIKVIT